MFVRAGYLRRRRVLGAAAILSLSIVATGSLWFRQQDLATGQRAVAKGNASTAWRMKSDAPGCLSREYLDGKILAFMLKRDDLGFRKALAAGIAIDQCRWIASGEAVSMAKTGLFTDPCVHVRGEAECWFVPVDSLERAD